MSRIFKFRSSLTKITGALHEYLIIFEMISPSVFLNIKNGTEKFVQKTEHAFYIQKFCLLWSKVEEYIRDRQVTNDNMPHAHGHKLAFRICKMYSFSTVTLNARTRLNVTLQYLACLVMNEVTPSNNLSILSKSQRVKFS